MWKSLTNQKDILYGIGNNKMVKNPGLLIAFIMNSPANESLWGIAKGRVKYVAHPLDLRLFFYTKAPLSQLFLTAPNSSITQLA